MKSIIYKKRLFFIVGMVLCLTMVSFLVWGALSFLEWRKYQQNRAIASKLYDWDLPGLDLDFQLYCSLRSLIPQSCYDEIKDKENNLHRVHVLVQNILSRPNFAKNILEKGRLEKMIEIQNSKREADIDIHEIRDFFTWHGNLIKTSKDEGKRRYLIQDKAYVKTILEEESKVSALLMPPEISQETRHNISRLAQSKKDKFFNDRGIPAPEGDGLSIESAFDFKNNPQYGVLLLLDYAHSVLNAKGIRLDIAEEDGPDTFKIILYDVASGGTFSLYIIADESNMSDYLVL